MNAIQHPVLIPMAVYVFYVFIMFLLVFVTRFKAVKGGLNIGRYYKNYADKSAVPEKFLVIERHVDNQFQLPMIFLVTGVLVISLQKETPHITALSWMFVLSRFVHSYIHLGNNNVLKRAGAYAMGWAILVAIWVVLLF